MRYYKPLKTKGFDLLTVLGILLILIGVIITLWN